MYSFLSFLFRKPTIEEGHKDDSKVQDKEYSQESVFFSKIVFGFMCILTISQVIICFLLPHNLLRWLFVIGSINLVGIAVLFLIKINYTRTASVVFISFLLTTIFSLAWTAGGIISASIQFLPLVVLITGLLLGWKAGLYIGLISSIGTFGLVLCQYLNILPTNLVTPNPLSLWVNLTANIGLLALFQYFTVANLNKALRAAQQELILRKKAENEIQSNEIRYRSIFENANDAIFIMKGDKFIDCNTKTLEIYGCTKDQIVNKSPHFFSPKYQPDGGISEELALQFINKTLDGSPQRFDWQHTRFDGSFFEAEVSLNRLDINDEILILAIVRDITERKKAEEIIKDKEQRIRAIFDLSFGFIGLLSIDGILMEANHSAIEFAGIKQQDVLGKYFWETPWWNHSAEMQEQIKTSIHRASLGEMIRFEAIHPAADGIPHTIDFSLKPVKDETGKVLMLIPEGRDITERIIAEETIRKNEERFRLILENMPILLNAFDENGNIIAWNKACETVTGYLANDVIGNPKAMEWFYPDPEYRTKIWDSSLDPENNINTFDLLSKSGELRTIEWFDTYHHITIPGWTSWGMGQDITQRLLAENTLQRNEQRLQRLLNSLTDYTYTVKIDNGKVTETIHGEGCVSVTGYSTEEFDLNNFLWINIVHNNDKERVIEQASKIIQDKNAHPLEHRIIHKNGKVRWVRNTPVLHFSTNCALIGYDGLVADITERKEAEIQLLKEKETSEHYLNIAGTILVAFDIHGKITMLNRKGYEVLGYNAGELIGKNWLRVCLPLEEYDNVYKIFCNIIEGKIEMHKYNENTIIAKNGDKRYVLWHNSVLKDNMGNISGILSSGEDITELKNAERRVLYASIEAEERERSYFANELHDGIGPLLSTIKLYFQWLNKPELHTPKEEIMANAEATIQEAILSVKEISQKLSPHILMNFGLIFAIKSFTDKLIETTSIKIKLESNIETRFEKEIEVSLYRVIIECINNTLKYAKANNISIVIMKVETHIYMDYTDDGIGFDHNETAKSSKGIGLFNMQNRIALLGGTIAINSEIGKGVEIKAIVKY